MSLEEYEAIIFNIITVAGEAKARAYDALRMAKESEFKMAKKTLIESDKILASLHTSQMELIQKEIRGQQNEFSVLLVHALDIMMDSMAVRDMVAELIDLYQLVLTGRRVDESQ